jgi:CRISPR-associated protein Csm5
MNMKLKAITPLHVGSGAEYNSSEFYPGRMGGKIVLVRADIAQLFLQLSDEEQEDFILKLEYPQFKLHNFLRTLNENGKKIDFSKIRHYIAYLNSDLEKVSHREVHEHIKTSYKAYIPGSSIKGAIKTALLYDMVKSDDVSHMNRLFSRGRDNRVRLDFRKSQDFQDRFFSAARGNASYTSIMKFIQISDTSTIPKVSIYTTASVKATRTGYEWYQRVGNMVKTSLETIDQGNELRCQMNITQRDEILRKLEVENKRNYLEDDNILDCIYRFSDDIIHNEINFAGRYDIKFLEDFYSKLKSKNNPKNPLLNIGHGTGFLGTTIGLKIKDEDPEIYENVRESTRGRTYSDEFPKTRKIILDENIPLGWVQVEIE